MEKKIIVIIFFVGVEILFCRGGQNGSMLEEVTIEHHARLAELAQQRRALRQKLAEIVRDPECFDY